MSGRRIFLLLVAVVSAFGSAFGAAFAQEGFAGLGRDAPGFATVTPGRTFTFPADHGPHNEHRIEWWYVTANLTDEHGEPLGLQWTLFRQSLRPGAEDPGWASQMIFMGHAAVTTAETHRFAERFARGGVGHAGVNTAPFEAWIDDWSFAAPNAGEQTADASMLSPARVSAQGENFSYDVALEATGPLVLQGEEGYSVKSAGGQASYYYSQPFFRARGTVTIDGRAREVSGLAWMDREWSSQPLGGGQEGWDWFSLHLDGGEKVMLFRLRENGGKDSRGKATGKNFISGAWIAADGETVPLSRDALRLTPRRRVRVAGRRIPVEWRIEIPRHNLSVNVTPLNPQSYMSTVFPYWEGPIRVDGSHTGAGYLEMTGY